MAECLDEDAILAYVLGQLDETGLADTRRHIDVCAGCRTVVAQTARSHFERSAGVEDAQGAGRTPAGDRYTILQVVGSGASGVIYSAHDRKLDRKVALKLLRGEGTDEVGQLLLREARLMAQLSHPHVVHVHDVGTIGDQVYLSMEYVDGENLASWQKGRSTEEIVDAYAQAGRGLWEAHRHGLVHRDFKPENVVVARDGVVRVTDFGLARPLGSGVPAGAGNALAPGGRSTSLTGTPAYMAPEQFLGSPADPRTDQFSFCVSLFEALYETRPFAGETLDELAANITAGRLQRPSKGGVPAHLRRLLERGLSTRPEARFPSMKPLLDDLRPGRRSGWARAAAALVAVAAGLGGASVWARHERGICAGGAARLGGVWDPAVREAAHRALVMTGAPFAEASWRSVSARLDEYGARWAEMHHEACEAHRRGEQSAEALDVRMQCLDARLGELRGLTQLFTKADLDVAQRAVEASHALAPIALCADVSALLQPVRLPGDAALRRRVNEITDRMAEARALLAGGHLSLARERADGAAQDAAKTGFLPLQARAQLLAGGIRQSSGDSKGAEEALYRAAALADEARDDRVRAQAWNDLLHDAASANRAADAARLAALAQGAIARLGGDDELEAGRENGLATLLYGQGKFDEAFAQYAHVLELRKHAFGEDSPQAAGGHYSLGVLARGRGRFDEALAELRAAQAIWEQQYGPDHPQVARTLSAIGAVLINQKKYDEAVSADELAVARGERALGPDHPELASYLQNLAIAHVQRKELKEAMPYLERALAIIEKKLPPAHPTRATALAVLGQVYVGTGRAKEAVELLERALALRSEAETPPRQLADMRFILATALWNKRPDRARARALAKQALDVYAKAGPPFTGQRDEVATWLLAHR